MSRPGKIRRKPQNICTWIRHRTSPYCFGVKTERGNPAHANRNDDIAYHFHQAGKARKKPVASVSGGGNSEEKTSIVPPGVEKKVSGSISGRHHGGDELAELKSGYLSLAGELLDETKLVAAGRRVVTEEDMAVPLMLLRFFSLNMNADGSLPVARWREMWRAMFGSGDVKRAWCHHRFAAVRNFLSDQG